MQNFLNLTEKYPFLKQEFLGNELSQILLGLLVFLSAFFVLKIFKTIIIVRLKALSEKTETELDDILINAINAIHWPFYVFISFYIGLRFLNISDAINKFAYYIVIAIAVYYGIKFAQSLIDYGLKKILTRRGEKTDKNDDAIIKLAASILKIFLWIGAFVLLLSNMGYNVTSLIAGLGVGGIAVALALQSILGDLFSSLAIYLDKPFKVGDFIIVGDKMGTVKKVGIKTTRIQALQGEEIVMTNSDLTKAQIQNFGVMEKRRVVFKIGVSYETPADKLKKISGWLSDMIKAGGGTEIERIHFASFGDSSLLYEAVYYVNSADYAEYMNTQQKVNLAIVEKFNKEKIEIAFPTRTVYLKK